MRQLGGEGVPVPQRCVDEGREFRARIPQESDLGQSHDSQS
jgi:hypothetical protein